MHTGVFALGMNGVQVCLWDQFLQREMAYLHHLEAFGKGRH